MIPYVIVFLFGAVIGSFLERLYLPITTRKSLSPARLCIVPPVGNPSVYDNIPIVGYLLLRAVPFRRVPISTQYPLVEAVNAIGYVLMFWMFDFTAEAFVYSGLTIGIDCQIIGTDLFIR